MQDIFKGGDRGRGLRQLAGYRGRGLALLLMGAALAYQDTVCSAGTDENIFKPAAESTMPKGEMGYLFEGRGDGVDTCPVTGDKLERTKVKGEFFGRTVYFCCSGCLKHARRQPSRFLKPTLEEQRTAMVAVRAKAETIDRAEFCD